MKVLLVSLSTWDKTGGAFRVTHRSPLLSCGILARNGKIQAEETSRKIRTVCSETPLEAHFWEETLQKEGTLIGNVVVNVIKTHYPLPSLNQPRLSCIRFCQPCSRHAPGRRVVICRLRSSEYVLQQQHPRPISDRRSLLSPPPPPPASKRLRRAFKRQR